MTVAIAPNQIEEMLGGLMGRELSGREAAPIEPHPRTLRGLVTNDNELIAVVGSDLDFAHYTGAALAMIPKGRAEDANGVPDDDLLEVYVEVANVMSRLIDEAMPMRVRIDPGLNHSEDDLLAIAKTGVPVTMTQLDVDGYGGGVIGVWRKA
jgi:hypothetical protein